MVFATVGQTYSGQGMTLLTAQQCAVVLVHYNNVQDTLACLRSICTLQNQPNYIVITDNGSQPEALQALREGWVALCGKLELAPPVIVSPDVQGLAGQAVLLTLSDNTGFSGGNNAALRLLRAYTNCTAFWLLNNDTEPAPNALDALCARLNTFPSAGICGSTLVYTHRVGCLQCTGGGSLLPWLGTTKLLNENLPMEQITSCCEADVERRMAFVGGASMLVKREVLEQVGLLPEEYFLYYEEVAYAQAVRRAGFRLTWAPQSIVYHKEGGSSGAKSDRSQKIPPRSRLVDYLSLRNRVFLMRTYYPWSLPLVALSYLGVVINRIRRGQIDRIGLVCSALWHGLIGRMGKPRADI